MDSSADDFHVGGWLMSEGVDYSWSRPGGAALAAAGKSFAGRYLWPGGGKGLTAAEVADLHAHGISVFTIFESSADHALTGFVAGVQDARTAQGQLAACGLPAGQTVYFGVDFDAQGGQLAAIDDYLNGAGSVLGQPSVGVYGSYRVTTYCRASGTASRGFQTYAWSHGQVDGGADYYQYSNGQNINGSVDLVRGSISTAGLNATPLMEDDMLPDERAALLNIQSALPDIILTLKIVDEMQKLQLTNVHRAEGDISQLQDNANGVTNTQQILAKLASFPTVSTAPTVDVAAIAKAVNDDAAQRMVQ